MPIAWNRINTLLLVLVLLVLAGALARGVLGGPLDPPAPPASTMKTLEQVEPRIPISQPASAAGFPITITERGSYYLTGNITGVAGKDGIYVTAHDVTIDLNGFTLMGVPGSVRGIYSTGWDTTVLNGRIEAWGVHGAEVSGAHARFSRMQAHGNSGNGILIDDGVVEDSVLSNNGLQGVRLNAGVVRGNLVTANSDVGIVTNGSVLVERNDVFFNTGGGMRIQNSAATVRDNVVNRNDGGGILVTGGFSRIEGNTVTDDASGTIPFGIRVTGTANFIGRNTASHNADNFDIVAGNTAGPEETGAATTPWSNVNY